MIKSYIDGFILQIDNRKCDVKSSRTLVLKYIMLQDHEISSHTDHTSLILLFTVLSHIVHKANSYKGEYLEKASWLLSDRFCLASWITVCFL